jgi:hypothetical protein
MGAIPSAEMSSPTIGGNDRIIRVEPCAAPGLADSETWLCHGLVDLEVNGYRGTWMAPPLQPAGEFCSPLVRGFRAKKAFRTWISSASKEARRLWTLFEKWAELAMLVRISPHPIGGRC